MSAMAEIIYNYHQQQPIQTTPAGGDDIASTSLTRIRTDNEAEINQILDADGEENPSQCSSTHHTQVSKRLYKRFIKALKKFRPTRQHK